MIGLTVTLALYAVGACPDKDQRCISCNGSKCMECVDSYIDPEGRCVAPSIRVEHCIQYKKDGVCEYCAQGYHVNSLGKCVEISIPLCIELATESLCAVCSNGLKVKNGRCDQDEVCSIANCELCALKSGKEVCLRCKHNYAVHVKNGGYHCIVEQNTTKNCLYVNSFNPQFCAVCDYNYYMAHHTCKKSLKYSVDIKGLRRMGVAVATVLFVLFR